MNFPILKSFFSSIGEISLFWIISFDQQQNQPFAALLSVARARTPSLLLHAGGAGNTCYPGDSTEFETPSSICKVTPTALIACGSKWAYAQYTESDAFLASRVSASAQTSTVQVTNRTIGSAMSRLKNTLVSTVYLQLLERTLSFQPGEQNDGDHAADSPETKPSGPRASRLTFVEDFLLEHSAPGAGITSIEISGSF